MAVKKVEILNYRKERFPIEIDMSGVRDIYLKVISGDEVLDISYYNGSNKVVDPMAEYRYDELPGGSYYIYDQTDMDNVYNLMDNSEWLNRRSSSEYPIKLMMIGR